MSITFTGEVVYAVRATNTPEYGPLGASVELHIILEPQADDAFRGLWRSEAGFSGGGVVTNRTVCSQGYVVLGLGAQDDELVADVDAVIAHLAKVNAAYATLEERGAARAESTAKALAQA
jgi:hypothetical protein